MVELSRAARFAPPEAKPPKILPETHFAAGRMFEEHGDIGKAITQYRKAVSLNHHHVGAYHRLGRMYSIAGRHERAIEALARAIEIKPDNAILHNDLSFEYMFLRRWKDAERSLRRAIALRPTMARAHINLALVQSKQGRFEDALHTFRRVLPEADAYYNLGLLYRGQRDYAMAMDAFRRVLDVNTEFAAARTQIDELMAMRQTERTPKVESPASALADAVDAPPAKPSGARRATNLGGKVGSAGDGKDSLTEIIRSILAGSAECIRHGELATGQERTADKAWPDDERIEWTRERDDLIETINAALDARVASAKTAFARDISPVEGGGRDPLSSVSPRRSRVRDEMERLSYNTEEEFIEEEAAEPAISGRRVEWRRGFVTLNDLIDIVDNEVRCFEERDLAEVGPYWPPVDARAYTPVELSSPRGGGWDRFQRIQDKLDRLAEAVTAQIRTVESPDTESQLAALERDVASIKRRLGDHGVGLRSDESLTRNHSAPARDARPLRDRRERRDDRMIVGIPRQDDPPASLTASPVVMASPFGPPEPPRTGRGATRQPVGAANEPARAAGRARLYRRGHEVDWREEFRELSSIASVVANDVHCLSQTWGVEWDSVAAWESGVPRMQSETNRDRTRHD